MKTLTKLLPSPFRVSERYKIKKLIIKQRIKESDEILAILREENQRLRAEFGLLVI